MEMSRSLRIVCVGDSLTAGYVGDRKSEHPYSKTFGYAMSYNILRGCVVASPHLTNPLHIFPDRTSLQKLLDDASTKTNAATRVVDAVPYGFCGADSSQILDICKSYMEDIAASGTDVAFIMAGTNDLVRANIKPENTIQTLLAIHALFHARGIATVAMTIPESGIAKSVDKYVAAQRKTNELIKDAFAPKENLCFVDAEDLIRYESSGDSAAFWLADGLHFSTLGYDEFGRRLASAVWPFVAALTALPQVSMAKVRVAGARESGKLVSWLQQHMHVIRVK